MSLTGPRLEPRPISRTQILGWIGGGIGPVRHLSRTPEVENLRQTINEHSRHRVEQGDGWWIHSPLPAMRVVRRHNVRCGRGLVVDRLARALRTGAWVLDWAGGTGWTASMLLERRPGFAESMEAVAPKPVARRLGFTQIPWAEP
jgi:hypothetical protein